MLRVRLGLLVAGSVLVALAAFAVVVDASFVRQQRAQLDALVVRELRRVETLVQRSDLGATFLGEEADLVLQFVDAEGTVQLPPDAGQVLPLRTGPDLVRRDGGSEWLVASAPWRLPSGLEAGTIRLGLNFEPVLAARRTLWRAMATSGAALAVAATVFALALLQRALGPLQRLVRDADAIDPSRPELVAGLRSAEREDEVGRLARALERAMQAIRDRQQAERDALAEVAHELAAPLSVVAGRLRAVEAHEPSAEIRSAREAADELLHTSRDLLTLARGELERPMDFEAVDLADLVRGVASEMPPARVVASGEPELLGSPERLRQAVRNLLRNAFQAGGDPHEVRAELKAQGAEIVLEVLDRGVGLAAGDEERIFERHVSGRTGGSGLGLAVARAVVDAHDGSLRAERRAGGGTRFVARFPTLEARLETEPVVPEPEASGSPRGAKPW